MVNSNIFIFLNKFLPKVKKNYIKQNIIIKLLNRNIKIIEDLKHFNLGVYNGKLFMPIYIDTNKLNYMLGLFSFSHSIKLKKKIKVYKKKKKRKK